MTIPSQQSNLFDSLCAKLESILGEPTLAAFMGTALKSLLRRQGDTPFLEAIRDAYVAAVVGKDLPEQRKLARAILNIVMELRPEIARAWTEARQQEQAAQSWTKPERRSVGEQRKAAAAAAANKKAAGEGPSVEGLTANTVRETVLRKLASFNLPAPLCPSTAYYHDRPFFLFDRKFHEVFARFITDMLMPLCRPVLSRLVYEDLLHHLADPPESLSFMILKKRDDIDKALIQRLGALAALQNKAEDIISKADLSDPQSPTWKTIEIPQSRPRSMNILGVTFAVGSETVTRKITIRADGGRDLSAEEMEALTLFTHFRDMAAEQGIDLPTGCDFQFLRFLLEFDPVKFAQSAKTVCDLATHNMTTSDFLITRLKKEERLQLSTMSDVLLLLLFNEASDHGFGIADLHRFCVETAREPAELLRKRPFLYWEIARRPFELAFQIREIMRKRLPVNDLDRALRMLFATWKTMARGFFQRDMDIALGVIAAFPIVFAGEPAELHFTKIAERLTEALTSAAPDTESTLTAVTASYERILKTNL